MMDTFGGPVELITNHAKPLLLGTNAPCNQPTKLDHLIGIAWLAVISDWSVESRRFTGSPT
jgi:hypothetical protein